MSKNALNPALLALLSQNEPFNRAQGISLQNQLNDAGFTVNFSAHGADGVVGKDSLTDIVNLATTNPQALLSLGPHLTQRLFDQGFGNQIMGAINQNPAIRQQLLNQANTILDGRNPNQLSSAELESVQTAWTMTGHYSKSIDGKYGTGTQAAFEVVAAPAPTSISLTYNTTASPEPAAHNDHDMGTDEVMALIDEYPGAILNLTPEGAKTLYEAGHGDEIATIMNQNPAIRQTLLARTNDVLGGRHPDTLNELDLEFAQTDWKLAGLYSRSIDGVTGDGTRDAFSLHQIEMGQISPVKSAFAGAIHGDDTNGYGVSNAVIEAAWQDLAGQPTAIASHAVLSNRELIVLDAGHGTAFSASGRSDSGAVSPDGKITEVDLIDPVAQALADEFKAKGYEVAFTRQPFGKTHFTHGETIGGLSSREVRGAYAQKLGELTGQDVTFISLHVDDNPHPSVQGTQIYVGSHGIEGDGEVNYGMEPINQDLTNFGQHLATDLSAKMNTGDFGALTGFSNAGTGGVATLIELGNLQNPHDVRTIQENPAAIAGQIADSVDSYLQTQSPAPIRDAGIGGQTATLG